MLSIFRIFRRTSPHSFQACRSNITLRFCRSLSFHHLLYQITLANESYASEPPWAEFIPPPPETGPPGSLSWSSFVRDSRTIVMDVRSPSEFLADHIPGAINVPVLSDTERSYVGRLHSEGNKLKARMEGAALICANLSRILRDMSNQLAPDSTNNPSRFNFLIYCARGGQRSNSLATLLTQIGWPSQIGVLVGGYRSWRRLLLRQLDAWPLKRLPGQFWVISGLTGSGKSLVISELSKVNEAVLDLEQLANHRGSIFGAATEFEHDRRLSDTQTSSKPATQRQFDSRLHHQITTDTLLQTAPVIWIECESRFVGPYCRLPQSIWTRLRSIDPPMPANRVYLEVPEEARVSYIIETYSEYTQDSELLNFVLNRLEPYHPAKRISQWRSDIDRGDFPSFVGGLLRHHYDPLYTKSRAELFRESETRGLLHKFHLPTVDVATVRSQLVPYLLELTHQSACGQNQTGAI